MRAIYVWGYGNCLIGTYATNASFLDNCGYPYAQAQRDSFFYVLRNPQRTYQPFNRIYFEVDATILSGYPALVQSFLAQASANGIAVELLVADNTFVTSTAGVQNGVQVCQAVATFNANAPANAEFDGVHFDLEPHTLSGWTSSTTALNGTDKYNDYYEANLVSVFRGCRSALAGTGISLSWDANVIYPKFATDVMTPLFNERLLDYITMMNYYNTEAKFVNGSGQTGGVGPILQQLKGIIPAVFAAETQSAVAASISWSSNGSLPLENMFGNVGNAYASAAGFLGTVVHDYDAYIFMNSVGAPVTPACTLAGQVLTITTPPSIGALRSVAVYLTSNYAYVTNVNLSGPGPYTVTLPAKSTGPFSVNTWDGPNLTRAALDSLSYHVDCV